MDACMASQAVTFTVIAKLKVWGGVVVVVWVVLEGGKEAIIVNASPC